MLAIPAAVVSPKAGAASSKGRRQPPSPAEQARRKAWGRKWGQVGHDYHLALLAREAAA